MRFKIVFHHCFEHKKAAVRAFKTAAFSVASYTSRIQAFRYPKPKIKTTYYLGQAGMKWYDKAKMKGLRFL